MLREFMTRTVGIFIEIRKTLKSDDAGIVRRVFEELAIFVVLLLVAVFILPLLCGALLMVAMADLTFLEFKAQMKLKNFLAPIYRRIDRFFKKNNIETQKEHKRFFNKCLGILLLFLGGAIAGFICLGIWLAYISGFEEYTWLIRTYMYGTTTGLALIGCYFFVGDSYYMYKTMEDIETEVVNDV